MQYTYENLMIRKPVREEFLTEYKRLIVGLKKHGYLEAAKTHAKNRARLEVELSFLD